MKINVVAWGVQILMGILFLIASAGKVISHPEAIQNFENWGYPPGFYMIIGLLELIGGVLLFYPKTAGYASIILFSVMIGAVITHILHAEWIILLKPIIHIVGLVIVFYVRFIEDIINDDAEQFPLNQAL
ncbi:MAG: DoxX family protein [Reichenbachiella sp.]